MHIHFDHISLSAKDPEGMRDFLCALLDLRVGDRPGFSFDGYFLCAGDKDLIHIFGQTNGADQAASGPTATAEENIVNHVSFFTDDYAEAMTRIKQLNLSPSIFNRPGSDIKQIFVRGPENLLIEIQAVP